MNNLLSYCRLVDAKIRASDKDLPVLVCNVIEREIKREKVQMKPPIMAHA